MKISLLINNLIMLSITMMFINHPMSVGISILLTTIMMTLITGMMSLSFWFSYMLFMIMVGGMMVMFIYMTSTTSNKKFKLSKSLIIILIMTMMTYTLMSPMKNEMKTMNMNTLNTNESTIYQTSLSKYINYPMNMLMLMMIIYLFIAMTAVIKITETINSPLRHK